MKNLLLIGVLAAAGFAIVSSKGEPKFYIESYDRITKTGVFYFDNIRNMFGNSGGSVSGKNGYTVTYGNGQNGTPIFKLYKNGSFVKNIGQNITG